MKKSNIIEKTFSKAKKNFDQYLIEKDDAKDIINKTFSKAKVTFANYLTEKELEKQIEVTDDMFDHSVHDIDISDSKVTVTLIHNQNNNLFDVELTFENLRQLPSLIYKNRDIIYDRYIGPYTPPKRVPYEDYGDNIRELLTGNFIISEFGEFIGDEFGNCLTFE
jgi:hypothetical protein